MFKKNMMPTEPTQEKRELESMFHEIMSFYVKLANQLPGLREDSSLLETEVKAISEEGIKDVASKADLFTQEKIKEWVEKNHPEWQFWGEEGADNVTDFDPSKKFLLITDPIEGTNNFLARKDNQWGSVIAVVDTETKEPIIGVIAHPAEKKFYTAIKGQGAYVETYDKDGSLISKDKLSKNPEYEEYTYNNSPHFNQELTGKVEKFFEMGQVQSAIDTQDELELSRKVVNIVDKEDKKNKFVDPESGALEAVRYRGTIYFKTSNEMAAVFVILKELGGNVTDGDGKAWSLGINTMISARNEGDYQYLKDLYDQTSV